tara:strand:+ start:115 stop:453 length:339 start_codon:yes stop_codon:yes gene_type:complete
MGLNKETGIIWEAPPAITRGFGVSSMNGMVRGMDRLLEVVPSVLANANRWGVLAVFDKSEAIPSIYGSITKRIEHMMQVTPQICTEDQMKQIEVTTRTFKDGTKKVWIRYVS